MSIDVDWKSELAEVADKDIPSPSAEWLDWSERDRLLRIKNTISETSLANIEFIEARENGYIIVSLVSELNVRDRAELLLDIEDELKSRVESALTIWLEPRADKSALRKFRGVEVK